MTAKERAAMQQALEALETLDCGDSYKTHNAAAALRAALAEQAEQEPVARVIGGVFEPCNDDVLSGTWELYAHPVRVQDLTDDEMEELCRKYARFELIREAIAADREKNK